MHFFFYKREGGSKGGEVEEGGRGERVGCSFCSTQKVHCAVKLYIHIRNVKPSASASWILVTVNKITLPTILSPFFSFHSKKKRERERDRERHREREREKERERGREGERESESEREKESEKKKREKERKKEMEREIWRQAYSTIQ